MTLHRMPNIVYWRIWVNITPIIGTNLNLLRILSQCTLLRQYSAATPFCVKSSTVYAVLLFAVHFSPRSSTKSSELRLHLIGEKVCFSGWPVSSQFLIPRFFSDFPWFFPWYRTQGTSWLQLSNSLNFLGFFPDWKRIFKFHYFDIIFPDAGPPVLFL